MKNKKMVYLWLIPAFIIMGVFVYYPILVTFTYSIKKMKLTAPNDIEFIGLENYKNVLQSEEFWYALQNTVVLIIIVVSLTLLFGFIEALILEKDVKFKGLLTAIAIIPWAMPPIVNGIIWKFIFYPGYGFLNKLLLQFHLIEEPIEWISSRWSLIVVAAIVVAWRAVPFCAIVCLSGMKSVPPELYESAELDGCGPIQKIRYITIPLILPFLGIGVTSASVTAINVFDEIVSLYGYGDMGLTLQMENYLVTFSFMDFGKGSAITYLIMLLAGALGIFYIKSLNKEVSY